MTIDDKYAGFWKRFAAYLVDEILLSIVGFFLFLPVLFFIAVFILDENGFDEYRYSAIDFPAELNDLFSNGDIIFIVLLVIIFALVVTIFKWLYFALMESSGKQATLGKMLLGLKVVDLEGNRISFLKATGRYFGKIISGLIFNIGYIIAAFTEKKQALHDIMAGCLIYDKTKPYFYVENNKENYYETN